MFQHPPRLDSGLLHKSDFQPRQSILRLSKHPTPLSRTMKVDLLTHWIRFSSDWWVLKVLKLNID